MVEPHFGEPSSVTIPWVDEDGEKVKTAVFSFTEERPKSKEEMMVVNQSVHRFKRAWYATRCEELDGAPYISQNALECYLVQTERLSESKMKTEVNLSKSGMIGILFASELVMRGGQGFVVSDPGLAEAMLEERGSGAV